MSKTIATFVQKVGLIRLKNGRVFTPDFQNTIVIVGIKMLMFHLDKRDNGVQGKNISGSKLVRMVVGVATHTCKFLS